MTIISTLQKYAETIRLMERAAFLHDLDKGSEEFLAKGGPVWHTLDNQKDSPEQQRLEKERRWQGLFGAFDPTIPDPELNYAELLPVVSDVELDKTSFGRLSSPFVCHHLSGGLMPLAGYIVHAGAAGADGIDSALDKVTNKEEIVRQTAPFQIATPFRRDVAAWDNSKRPEVIDKARNHRPLREYREQLRTMLGETRRPYNDVTLWDHSFNVATNAKCLTAKIIAEYHAGIRNEKGRYVLPWRFGSPSNEFSKYANPDLVTEYGRDGAVKLVQASQFQLGYVKIEFDLQYLLNRAHTAADLANAIGDVQTAMDELRDFYENSLLAGNETYRDHFRQLFLYPVLNQTINDDWEKELREQLADRARNLLRDAGLHELPYAVTFSTKNLASGHDKALLAAARQLLTDPAKTRQDAELLLELATQAKNAGAGRICDVCAMRKAGGRAADNSDHLCPACQKRRRRQRPDAGAMNTFNLQDLTNKGKNKLALFSIRLDLTKLRDGTLFQKLDDGKAAKNAGDDESKLNTLDVPPSPARLTRSYDVLRDFFSQFLENKVPIHAKNGYFRIILSQERLDFVVGAHVADDILAAFQQEHLATFGAFHQRLPAKVAIIVFYQKYPLYAAIDAVSNMSDNLAFGNFDFMLLDSAAQRFAFQFGSRQHHIFSRANHYTMGEDIARFRELWKMLNILPKSQISAIEEFLVEKFMQWSDDARRQDPHSFRDLCRLCLFSPNAFGKKELLPEQKTALLDAAVDGSILDVIELFIHLEDKK